MAPTMAEEMITEEERAAHPPLWCLMRFRHGVEVHIGHTSVSPWRGRDGKPWYGSPWPLCRSNQRGSASRIGNFFGNKEELIRSTPRKYLCERCVPPEVA